jgi:hypothetical protein
MCRVLGMGPYLYSFLLTAASPSVSYHLHLFSFEPASKSVFGKGEG